MCSSLLHPLKSWSLRKTRRGSHFPHAEVLAEPQRRRRWTHVEPVQVADQAATASDPFVQSRGPIARTMRGGSDE